MIVFGDRTFKEIMTVKWGFPGWLVVKNLPANPEDTRDTGSIPGSGRPPEGRRGNSLFLPGVFPRPEESGRLKFIGSQRVSHLTKAI